MKAKSTKIKSPEKFTSRDLMDYWYQRYNEIKGCDYSHGGFVGFELRAFKEALENYDVYSVLLAIETGIQDGEYSIRFFIQNIEKYIQISDYNKYYFLIEKYAPKNLKEKLIELGVLETKWLPTSQSVKNIESIIETFNTWLESKNF